MWNLQLWQADPTYAPGTPGYGTEVKTLPFAGGSWPAGWPTPDARPGGVPDPALAGPDMIQIGTEGGFLPGSRHVAQHPDRLGPGPEEHRPSAT